MLSPRQLRQLLVSSLAEGGWTTSSISAGKPFDVRAFDEAGSRLAFRAYIWNCTRGGNNRPSDEFRVQITGGAPKALSDVPTLVLGLVED